MWATIRLIRLFVRSLARTAVALEDIRDLYRLDLESRGVRPVQPDVMDHVEVMYGHHDFEED
jgi:hypothetical protein